MITIIDYDTGNLRSVSNALSRLGAEFCITNNHKQILASDKVLLPGVGEARSAMLKLQELGLVEVVKSLTQPVLGICIGVQLLCQHSDEGDVQCMGVFDSRVRKFSATPELKVPHMGWNSISNLQTPLFNDISDESYIYYVHSFAPELCSQTIATTTYGKEFSAALNRDNFFGTQFHPEKSGEVGEKILSNFLRL